jgi:DNA adenine methylase
VKPPFAYFGGKTKLADQIVAQLPRHEHYVEPFAGSLAVLLAKPPSRMETVNDLDGDLMMFWRVLREQPDELIRACALTPHSRGEYALSFDRPTDLSDLERARRTWVNLAQGRTGTLASTGWRYKKTLVRTAPGGGGDGVLTARLASQVDKMAAVAARLSRVTLECKPALELIESYGAHADVLLYVDPPYLACVRAGGNYRHEMASEREHRELAEALRSCRASVVLSGYSSPLYSELYADWHVTSMVSFTTQGGAAKATAEVLWSNRTPAHDLFGAVS